jgi:tRNA dimethylallyltransferase
MPLGYKEFHGYLSALSQTDKALTEAVENMKTSTRQYSRKQISWIRNKLLPAIHATNAQETTVPIYLLDATGKISPSIVPFSASADTGEPWASNVCDPAVQISRSQ